MRIIDADTHVDETEDTWEYMQQDELQFKPTTQYPANPNPNLPPTRYWLIDGKRQLRFIRGDEESGTVVEARELLDVQTRLKHMDELGTDLQVMYPTLFLMEATERPEVSIALRRSYNRWLADRCGQSNGRLRWICVPPLQDMGETLKELRFAKEHGACGVLKKGDREAGKWAADPYFFPLYEEAERLDLSICFHTGSGIPDFSPAREFTLGQFMRTKAAAVNGIETLIVNNIPVRYPKLRFGCIEAGASWVAFVDYDVRRRVKTNANRVSVLSGPRTMLANSVFKDNRIYITCQVDEDLPYILNYVGEDNLIVGSDYTHRDPSMEMEFRNLLQERAERGEMSLAAVQKILYENPKKFYSL
ncbi:MAG TPA: amidohydrolase family protein [Candidatus Binatia bacterium]|nr:amidohydrolase family protein [Candidatus Binatia bacterium]